MARIGHPRGLQRRQLIRLGGGAALAGWALGPVARAAARPATQHGVIQLRFSANVQGVAWNHLMISLDQEITDSGFNATHRGMRATVDPNHWGQDAVQVAAALAGGIFDDVIAGCCDIPQLASAAPLTAS